MIDKNSLRLWNIYNQKHGKGFTETVITEEIIGKIFSDSKEYALNDFEPIPISESLLVQCGFEKGEYDGREQWLGPWIERHNPYTKNRLGIMKDMFGYVYEGETFKIRLDHFHVLMNLHYLHTGEELVLNK